ncbi:MAG: GNAT family N-acetyltransferase [Candidatus Binatia bacterium]
MEKVFHYTIRPVRNEDEPFLWEMLYYAAHLDEDGEVSIPEAMRNPTLAKYVQHWGRAGDVGCIAVELDTGQLLGAAWVRLLTGADKVSNVIDETTPELAIAVLPEHIGKGIGAQLLTQLLDAAKTVYSTVVLSVRATNPAKRLYERLGFVVVDEITNRVGSRSFVMRVEL